MKEYEEAAAIFYDSYFLGVEGDVQFYLDEARRVGSAVLELGCGTGRVLLPLAEAGVQIVGLDNSPAMLAVLRHKLARYSRETQRRVELLEGDMRFLALGRRFDLILIPYRAFLHLLTPKDQRQALLAIREHLTEGGRLIVNVFDPNLEVIAAQLGPLGSSLKRDAEFVHPRTGRRVVVWYSFQYDPEHQLAKGYFLFEELDEGGQVLTKTYSPLTLRYVYRYEMKYLLELCGYRVEALYGDFRRGPFRYGGEQIWVARRTVR
ncbi:MAG: class I SAM-dependent methyltransferase [Candidatus Binatia bacterium]|nr:class I SAM-dependent methyltransferase [Candidatus Binatia bacterium]